MNNHEFKQKTPFDNDMKRKFDDNTEFAKEFSNPLHEINNTLNYSYNIDDEILDKRKKKKRHI